MKMIVGGACQGKVRFACDWLDLDRADIINGSTCDFDEAFSASVIKYYHKLVARLLAEGVDPVAFTKKLCEQNKDAVIIIDEVGCGIVPIEKEARLRREAIGRCGCIIAAASDTVVRVICGISNYLKGAPHED